MLAKRVSGALRRAWHRLWFQPFDPLPAAVLRIGFGLLLVGTYLALAPSFGRYFGVRGVLSLDDLRG